MKYFMCGAGIRLKDNLDATQKKASFARPEAIPGFCPTRASRRGP